MIDRAPEIMRFSTNLDEDLVQVPAPLVDPSHCFGSPLTDLVSKVGAKSIDPEADTFVTNIYAALLQKVFDIAKRERKSNVHHHAKLDDLGRCFEVPEGIIAHFPRLTALPGRLKTRFR